VSLFPAYCKAAGLPVPVAELRFAPPRRWRFDWALPDHKIALEVEGAVWVQGRHTRGSGFVKDMEKYNYATSVGWAILRVQPKDLLTETTLVLIKTTLANRHAT
jgi:very-short-patch-repair endonuclease